MLEAFRIILDRYPDSHLYTTGNNPLQSASVKHYLKQGSYGRYIAKLLKKYDLADKVTFCGRLDEQGMLDRYLKANVFAMPSAIENSPNSLGEAMIVGTPVVASDVGGVKNLLLHDA